MRDGIILINKPKGPSSNQTLQKVKQRLAIKKAGHFGTLDPLASGLLIIGLNKGTKLSKLFLNDDKSYEAVIKFGQRTNTDDAEGDVIDTSLKKVSKSEVVVVPEFKVIIPVFPITSPVRLPVTLPIKLPVVVSIFAVSAWIPDHCNEEVPKV